MAWSLNSTQNRTFHVQVYRGEQLVRSAWTRATALEVAGLEAGVLYGVRTSYRACGASVASTVTVRTGNALASGTGSFQPGPVGPAEAGG